MSPFLQYQTQWQHIINRVPIYFAKQNGILRRGKSGGQRSNYIAIARVCGDLCLGVSNYQSFRFVILFMLFLMSFIRCSPGLCLISSHCLQNACCSACNCAPSFHVFWSEPQDVSRLAAVLLGHWSSWQPLVPSRECWTGKWSQPSIVQFTSDWWRLEQRRNN